MDSDNDVSVSMATPDDVPIVGRRSERRSLRTSRVATAKGTGPHAQRNGGVLRALKTSRLLVARRGREVVGTVRLEAKKPWAIDPSYFTSVQKAVYLHDLAVAVSAQGHRVGRLLVDAAKEVARHRPGDAVRLDAYDHTAGAAPFYVKCGFREVGRVTYRGVPLVYFELLF